MARRSKTPTATADTREKLIEVAARHFAEHGYRGASQREIQRELGVNPGAVHYHFGSKEALYRGVIDAFIHGVQEERLKLLKEMDPELVGRARLRRLLYSYFYPHVALASTAAGLPYARILAGVQHEYKTASAKIFDDIVAPVRNRYIAAILELFPDTPRAEIQRLLAMSVALMAVTATWHDSVPKAVANEEAVRELARELARFTAAGFEAHLGEKTRSTGGAKRKRAVRKTAR
ncbi:AcrR family transcriptional regulator [Povalibacter uvarum]|uniref:AcrR family transcriptional regulator n=1 Tax=Povalibacter uvarum TaxID=732238 RepID=A0A841HK86_9GAMM|nr:TetR/AcrR family transcriptional regulator [Povalibacter uvarum]MBB6093457.1 AcrR family transcriptional regulator [Povalibacter uvarum]